MSTGSIEPSPSPSPGSAGSQTSAVTIPNGAPKFGTLVPNRVFVGGISSNTTESELHQLFSAFGNVKQTKIIADRAGVSKGYGFVTFETEEEARRLQQAEADNIMLKERKLNIAPAIKKQQPFGRQYEMGQPLVNGALYYHNGVPYTYQNGMAMFTAGPDGQPCQVGGTLVPTTNTANPTSPFPLLYGGGTIPSPAVYLPTPSLGSATAAAQAAASLTQQQFQFQTALNNAAAAQNQSPSSGGSTPGSGVPNPAAGWRWITPQTSTASSCHGQQSAAVAAATGPGHANAAAPQLTTQTFNYTQNSTAGFLPLEAFHYIPTGIPTHTGGVVPHHPFVIPDRTY